MNPVRSLGRKIYHKIFLRKDKSGIQNTIVSQQIQSVRNKMTSNGVKNSFKKLLTMLAPVLGAGAIGVCPLCWIGSASLLTYLGLGALIPVWRWIAFGLIALGSVGFILDYRAHKNLKPLILLVIGAVLLYVGRYVFLSTWGAWQIWGVGAVLIVAAVIYNKSFFRKSALPTQTL